ncbi:MAG: hypothetical protein ACC645_08850, partial [Pirellulales bacterium]
MLQRPALVLNRNWQPVNVATVARALVLVWNESARVVDPTDYQLYTWEDWSQLRPRDDERFIQAVRFRLCVPEVITLTGYRIEENGSLYFLTFAVVDWLPVFVSDAACRVITESLTFCHHNQGLRINAYVIMPTHFHAERAWWYVPITGGSRLRPTGSLMAEVRPRFR